MKVRRMGLNWSYLLKSSLLYAKVKCDASYNQKLRQNLHIIYLLPLSNQIHDLMSNTHHIQHYELLTCFFSCHFPWKDFSQESHFKRSSIRMIFLIRKWFDTLDGFKVCIFEHFQWIHVPKVLKNCLKAKKGQLKYLLFWYFLLVKIVKGFVNCMNILPQCLCFYKIN